MPTGTPLRNMLTDKDVRRIRQMARGGRFDFRAIAAEYGISLSSVRRIAVAAVAPSQPEIKIDPETGKAYSWQKLTAEQVIWARRRKMGGKTIAWIADECGVSYVVARDAICGNTWSYLPGAIPPRRDGRGYSRTSLTAEGVREIRRRFATEDVPKRRLAREYGVSPKHIRDILEMRVWANA